ncbi:MAG: single-stranded DNA-binding protein [Actinomycetota bacterium]
MATDNVVTLVGNITDEPELRFTPGGAAVANFTVAVNRRFRNQDGSWDDRLDGFFRCSCWRDMAENVSESLHKGSRVIVTGRLQQRSWDDNDGNKRSTIEVQVDEVGPSLRWATAQITKARRDKASQGAGQGPSGGGQPGGQAGGQGDSWNQGGGQGGGAPVGSPQPNSGGDDW